MLSARCTPTGLVCHGVIGRSKYGLVDEIQFLFRKASGIPGAQSYTVVVMQHL